MSLTARIKRKITDVLHSKEFSAADFSDIAPSSEVSRILARFEDRGQIERVGRTVGTARSLLTYRLIVKTRTKRQNTESARTVVSATPEQIESAMRLWRAMGVLEVCEVPRGRVHRSL